MKSLAPVRPAGYRFSPESIVQVRTKLGLSQGNMAAELGIPANTLSRWENGTTTPDADSLAAIYSLAVSKGVTPQFFQRRPNAMQKQTRDSLFVFWDFQNLPVSAEEVLQRDKWIRDELDRRCTTVTHKVFKVFARSMSFAPFLHDEAIELLDNAGWRIWEDSEDLDEDIIQQCRSDCGQDPEGTILVLVTRDGDYRELIDDMRNKGVRVYLMAPQDAGRKLVSAVGEKRWIKWTQVQSRGFNRLAGTKSGGLPNLGKPAAVQTLLPRRTILPRTP